MANSDISIHELPNGVLTESSLFVTSDAGQGTTYASAKHSAGEIGEYLAGEAEFNALTPENKTIIGSINELAAESLSAVKTGTLPAGYTDLLMFDNRIKSDSLLCCYTEPFGINPINMIAREGQVEIFFEVQSVDVNVAVEIRGQAGGGGGGGSDEPQFTETLICDNTALGSTLTFTDDFTDYEFIKFVIFNSTYQRYTEILTTPEMITNSFTYSSNMLNLNEVGNDQYCCYRKDSNTSWSRYGKRNCDVYEVYGLNCSNKTVSKTTLYDRQAISTYSDVVSSQTSLFNYNCIIFGSCTGSADETEPCNEVFYPKDDIFGRRGDTRPVFLNAYNRLASVRMSENEISSWNYYFFVQGIKFE